MPSAAPMAKLTLIRRFHPDLHERAWASIPHPTLPLIATAHAKSVTVFSLSTLSSHSALEGGHTRSVRTVAWKPGLPPNKLCLVSGSFDATAGLWRWTGDIAGGPDVETDALETEIPFNPRRRGSGDRSRADTSDDNDWEFTLVLEGHDSEIKSCAFAPSGAFLATCSRDKSVWIWEDIGVSEAEDEWETIAVLNEHEGDVKAVAWCPDVPGRNSRRQYSSDVLASASYDNTIRIWREDGDGEWVCVAVLEGHDGTVWGVEWEPQPRQSAFPRLLSHSADGTIRVWRLKEEETDEEDVQTEQASLRALGGIPNTMRSSLREEWACTSTFPAVHDRDIYSVTWSKGTSLIASTGRDGKIAIYQEHLSSTAKADSQSRHLNGQTQDNGIITTTPTSDTWDLLTVLPNSHGPFEVNHITWCRRFDADCEERGVEEMLVTTGDDGVVRSWQVKLNSDDDIIGRPT